MSGRVKHTPGPWKISHGGFDSDDGFSVASNNDEAELIKLICDCWPCSIVNNDHRKELAANARLIAAAPDLVEALQAIVQHQESVGGGLAVLSVTRKIAQDALDKAGVS